MNKIRVKNDLRMIDLSRMSEAKSGLGDNMSHTSVSCRSGERVIFE